MNLDIHVYIHHDSSDRSTEILNAIRHLERKMEMAFAKESEFIAALNDATNNLASRLQPLFDAAKDRPLNAQEQADGQAVIDRLNGMGTVVADPIPDVPPVDQPLT